MKRKDRDFWDDFFAPLREDEALNAFDLTSGATEEDVMRAFREKVRAMADGQGGYTGDMDALTQEKEQALKYLKQD
jgi:hypothetical protein